MMRTPVTKLIWVICFTKIPEGNIIGEYECYQYFKFVIGVEFCGRPLLVVHLVRVVQLNLF